MLELNHSQCVEIIEKLKPIDKVVVFDRYLNSKAASPVTLFGKRYYPSEILKTFDIEVYNKELTVYFEGEGRCLYTRIGEEYYRTFHVEIILKRLENSERVD